MPWYFALVSSVFARAPAGLGGEEISPGMRILSFWNSERFATSRRLNGVGDNWPSRIGWMKRSQRRREMVRKERMSRPECLERES
jgi:hypothetical protein